MNYNSYFMKKKENCFEKVCVIKEKERADWIEKNELLQLKKCCLKYKRVVKWGKSYKLLFGP